MLHLLASYAFMQTPNKLTAAVIETSREKDVCWWIDSGGFSAWKTGQVLDLNDYIRWIRRLRAAAPIKYIFQLDTVGDWKRTQKQLLVQERAGVSVIPIWTRGAPEWYLKELLQTHELVAIAGLGTRQNATTQLQRAINAVGVEGLRRCHLLACTKWDIIRTCRPYSTDSSSFNSAHRFGSYVASRTRGKLCSKDHDPTKSAEFLKQRVRVASLLQYDITNYTQRRGTIATSVLVGVTNYTAMHIRAALARIDVCLVMVCVTATEADWRIALWKAMRLQTIAPTSANVKE